MRIPKSCLSVRIPENRSQHQFCEHHEHLFGLPRALWSVIFPVILSELFESLVVQSRGNITCEIFRSAAGCDFNLQLLLKLSGRKAWESSEVRHATPLYKGEEGRLRWYCRAQNTWRVLFENRPALYFFIIRNIKKIIHVCWIPYLLMIL